jgi:hypothetical protein
MGFEPYLIQHELLNQFLFNIFISHFSWQKFYLKTLAHEITQKYDAHDMI